MTTIPSLGAPVPASQVDGWEEVYLSTKVEKTADAFEKRIAELEKVNAKLKKEVDKHRAGFVACLTGKQFTVNNLRQQAKGIEFVYELMLATGAVVAETIGKLHKQADELEKTDGLN